MREMWITWPVGRRFHATRLSLAISWNNRPPRGTNTHTHYSHLRICAVDGLRSCISLNHLSTAATLCIHLTANNSRNVFSDVKADRHCLIHFTFFSFAPPFNQIGSTLSETKIYFEIRLNTQKIKFQKSSSVCIQSLIAIALAAVEIRTGDSKITDKRILMKSFLLRLL